MKKYEQMVVMHNGMTIYTAHFGSAFNDDHSLCGDDLSGYNVGDEKWSKGTITNKRVNCIRCNHIVRYVRGGKRP